MDNNQRQGLNSSTLFQNDNVRGATGFSPKNQNSQNKSINRYTFKCPYCDEQNLTVDALRDHCNNYHKNGKKCVVCMFLSFILLYFTKKN